MDIRQRAIMVEALRLRPEIVNGTLWVRGFVTEQARRELKRLGFRWKDLCGWYWKPEAPQPLHKANKIRSRKYTKELTDPNS